jgi:hypothetical protein
MNNDGGKIMKKYNVQPRIYDAGKKFEGYADRYSIFFPLPKKYRKDTISKVRGVFLGCKPSVDGMIRCTWEDVKDVDYIGVNLKLGKRVKLESFPKPFQEIINKMTMLYNKALNENTEKAWQEWSQC